MLHFAALASAWWKPVLFVVIAGHLTNVCVTLFLHRAQTHRGVKLHYLAALPMRIWLWLSTAIVTKEWVACHRKHHAFADREGDPHSPWRYGDDLRALTKGMFHAHVGWLFDRRQTNPERYAPDLLKDRALRRTSGLFMVWVAAGLAAPVQLEVISPPRTAGSASPRKAQTTNSRLVRRRAVSFSRSGA